MEKSDRIGMYHHHIDNGGHTIEVDKYGSVEISTGFFGYCNVSMWLRGDGDFIDKAIEFLQEMKYKLKDMPKE